MKEEGNGKEDKCGANVNENANDGEIDDATVSETGCLSGSVTLRASMTSQDRRGAQACTCGVDWDRDKGNLAESTYSLQVRYDGGARVGRGRESGPGSW